MKKLRPRMTFANVVSCLALFVALGGSAFAATQLPKDSVGAAQLKADSVTASKVKAGSLLASDFKSGQLPAGERGPQGLPGNNGLPGAPGSPGVAETETVVESTADDATPLKELSVECPHGPVLSGGFVLFGEEQEFIRDLRSYSVTSNTWLVRASAESGQEWELTVTAICQK
jgi:hypothetical protein